jgi:hypothetical protein
MFNFFFFANNIITSLACVIGPISVNTIVEGSTDFSFQNPTSFAICLNLQQQNPLKKSISFHTLATLKIVKINSIKSGLL